MKWEIKYGQSPIEICMPSSWIKMFSKYESLIGSWTLVINDYDQNPTPKSRLTVPTEQLKSHLCFIKLS